MQDKKYDREKVLGKVARQFHDARADRRKKENTAEPGTASAAGRVKIPETVADFVIWTEPESGKKYVRIPGHRVVMVFEVTKFSQVHSHFRSFYNISNKKC